MNGFLFGFCIVALSSVCWTQLISGWLFIPFLLLSLFSITRYPWLTGGLFAAIYLNYCYLQLSAQLETAPQHLDVEIITLVHQKHDWLSADAKIISAQNADLATHLVRLSWAKPPNVKLGQHWRLTIKPKPITSILNQGGFNQQQYFLSRGIILKARVMEASLIADQPNLRQGLSRLLAPHLSRLPAGDLILALVLGDKQLIDEQRWAQLRHSGTGHLIAISGLHLTVIAGGCFYLAFLGLRLFPFQRLLPASLYDSFAQGRARLQLAIVLSLGSALLYAYLAGFSVSTQRALIMLAVLMLTQLSNRYALAWERLLYALFLVLLIDPFAVLSAGFWLSFSAISIIFLVLSQQQLIQSQTPQAQMPDKAVYQEQARWRSNLMNGGRALIRIQAWLTLGLAGAQLILFGQLTPYSFLINLLVVPYFSLVVIPLCLLSSLAWLLFQHSLGISLNWFALAELSLQPFTELIAWVRGLPQSLLMISDKQRQGLCLMIMMVFLWAYRQLYLPLLSASWWSIVFNPCRDVYRYFVVGLLILGGGMLSIYSASLSAFHTASQSSPWRVHFLDVGQGQAVVIEQNGHAWLYDTGAAYGDFTYAERAIIPFLQSKGLTLDLIVISHDDNDHAGGLAVMRQFAPQAQVIGEQACQPHRLTWQQLEIQILESGRHLFTEDNERSCVVKVVAHDAQTGERGDKRVHHQAQSLLLTGDIEQQAEHYLLAHHSAELQATVLSVPHHGSKTSSSLGLLEAVQPQVAIVSAGFNNRYRFPKDEVVARYQQQGIELFTTGREGQISIHFDLEKEIEINRYRQHLHRTWYNSLFEFGNRSKAE